ncbi:NapC/NirT family cytochrome c [Rhodocyclus tenuis]|uniref:NapC/NirT family cytochrome c n=1 Tax=Rhodocyclus tenuis TaxID=1066 RepID=UPI00190568A2|nr:NapC/NirT family cytochrome c [Rhodocyclus tenuis]MBK1681133.1 Denitrification system component NirT [Rhodocyclus tenuis]
MPNAVSRLLNFLRTTLLRPSVRYSLLALLGTGFIAGIAFIGGTHYTFEATSSPGFCADACHEMATVAAEYRQSAHYNNRSGVRADCADCHIPKPLGPKVEKKLLSAKELWGKITGSISTPEKFAAKRLELAQHEWARMKANDSRECRSCHQVQGMAADKQTPRASAMHAMIGQDGQTCIDCHKGIAHQLPENIPDGE